MRRENTFRIDYSNLPVKPSYERTYVFCRTVLGLKREDVKRLQCHRGESCAFVKVADLSLAQKVVEEHDDKHEVECNGEKYKLRITMEDGSVEVRVWDLPEDVSEEKIGEFLKGYGEVVSIRELMFGEGHEYGSVPLGIWSARMVLKRNIESWTTIDGAKAYIAYKGQLQSCRHCQEQAHTGITCIQNKKLLVQKSYANVTKEVGPQQQQRKPPASKPSLPKPPRAKPAGPKPAAAPSLTSENFPKLSLSSSQIEPSTSKTHTTNQPATMAVLCENARLHKTKPQPLASSDTPMEVNDTNSGSVDLFKKPGGVPRPARSTSNGNETDDSTTSTNSRRSGRGRPFVKKLRRDDEDDEKAECIP